MVAHENLEGSPSSKRTIGNHLELSAESLKGRGCAVDLDRIDIHASEVQIERAESLGSRGLHRRGAGQRVGGEIVVKGNRVVLGVVSPIAKFGGLRITEIWSPLHRPAPGQQCECESDGENPSVHRVIPFLGGPEMQSALGVFPSPKGMPGIPLATKPRAILAPARPQAIRASPLFAHQPTRFRLSAGQRSGLRPMSAARSAWPTGLPGRGSTARARCPEAPATR